MSEAEKMERDLEAIRALAGVLDETGLSEVEIERGGLRLRVSKGQVVSTVAAPAAATSVAAPAPAGTPAAVPAAPEAGAVRSPMVGTAYLSPSPGAAPFVTVGAQVSQGQTVMIVEAMKTMNEIKAPHAGTVKEILARDAEPVEYDETLLIIA
ncbi:acetyl-CoA carboxylase biotin carboxyl carrier protein [Parvularcula dongshanensis]|uniref:Biotin carboxyl carrier protein of acetyl-CoA carboxylase n=1 Tax=Parvularcula dongshanensis TaxID=1173995 RepID=A0A840I4U1_9PROT|nr:acetyl-CoA carboxylase biotin carboxyl carrier protein [Parvularcula dongshanensis]MBB4659859.1 acetyl-CoA carboxylase biotin carboxyl carrier protein [Parvularcula dongshanensis]